MLLSQNVSEFYEDGLLNILRMIPEKMSNEDRLLIEAVVYTGYGLFRTYSRLEDILVRNTSPDGAFVNSPLLNRDIFTDAWSLVDTAYALGKLSRLKNAGTWFSLSEETKTFLAAASSLRNYMDHLASNFGNVSKATGYAPLFGWLSYQFTPWVLDQNQSPFVTYVAIIGSTHLNDAQNIDAKKLASDAVLAPIDNITLSVRKSDQMNISKFFANLTLELNDFSIKTQTKIVEGVQDGTYQGGGIKIAFPQLTVRADRSEPMDTLDIVTPLNYNKVRATVTVDDISKNTQ